MKNRTTTSKAPYDIINDAVFAARQLTRLAKEAGEVEATMHEHALANLDKLPPQPVEAAIDYFLPKEAEAEGMPKEAAVEEPGMVKRSREVFPNLVAAEVISGATHYLSARHHAYLNERCKRFLQETN